MGGIGSIGPGTVVADDFEVQRPLGEGGMGSVFAVRQRSTGHERALKIMHPQLASNPMLRAKFVREAKIGSTIESDHVVQVIAAGFDDATGSPWLVMEMLQGQDLRTFVDRNGPPPPERTLEIMRQMGHAVTAAHKVGVVHRDLKPENVFVARSRRHDVPFTVKVLDFGIAKMAAEAATQASVAIGSPLWMAPEQAVAGANVAPAADVWALGLIAYFLFTGRVFWRAGDHEAVSAVAVLREVTLDDIPPPSVRALEANLVGRLPPGFDAWFTRCVDRDPARRFPDAGAALAAFEQQFAQILGGTSPRSQSPYGVVPSHVPSAHGILPSSVVPSTPTPSSGPSTVRDWTGPRSPFGSTPGQGAELQPTHLGVPPRRPTPAPIQVSAPAPPIGATGAPAWPPPYVPHPPTLQGSALTNLAPPVPAAPRRKAGPSPLLVVGLLVPVLAALGGGAIWFATRSDDAPKKTGKTKTSASASAGVPKRDTTAEARRLFYDRSRPDNGTQAATLFQQSCDDGFADGCAGVGLGLSTGVGAKPDKATAAKRFQGACDAGSDLGCALLADYMMSGIGGVSKDPTKAVSMLTKSCDANVPEACDLLANALVRGSGVAKDAKKAITLYEKSCNAGYGSACTTLGWHYEKGDAVLRDADKAFGLYKKACDVGDMLGCTDVGHAYDAGVGVPRDLSKAVELYSKACDAGVAVGCNNLGIAYRDGRGVAVDGSRAIELFKRACEDELDTEYLRGCSQLGVALQDGVGGVKDLEKGLGYLEKACNGGNMAGCTGLGYAYANGRGVAKDERRAAVLYQQACDGGDMTGCNNVGYFYETGKVLEKDIGKAVARYGQACTNGSAIGCVNLGVLYYGGKGVPVNNARAAELFDKACTLGSMLGCSNLGLMYNTGRGVTKDTGRARALFQQACDAGEQRGCDNLKK